jgi:hypothetical protein
VNGSLRAAGRVRVESPRSAGIWLLQDFLRKPVPAFAIIRQPRKMDRASLPRPSVRGKAQGASRACAPGGRRAILLCVNGKETTRRKSCRIDQRWRASTAAG